MFSDLTRDLRQAWRFLTASPTFTIVATLTLALGVGANTAIFSVVQALLLSPLPYAAPDRLIYVDAVLSTPDGETSFQLAYPDLDDIRTRAKTIATVAPWSDGWGLAVEGPDGSERLQANFVGRDYFKVLGAAPLLGRAFVNEEHQLGADGSLVVILSEAMWRQRFGADPSVVGKDIRLQGRPFTVVGVMPSSFYDVALQRSDRIDAWVPIERVTALFGGTELQHRRSRLMWAVARLADGATLAQAEAELRTIGAQVAAANPDTNANFNLRSIPLSRSFFADARQPLWMLLGGSLFVLLIGCANVANLLLVRATARQREIAVRLAIGGSMARVVRQLLVETTVLSLLGGASGVALAAWLTPVLVSASGIVLPGFAHIGLNGTVLLAALAISLTCGVLFGLAPAWRATRLSVRDTIANGSAGRVSRSRRTALWLAGVEVTASFVLAAGALLMLQSFSALTRTDLSFRHDHLLAVCLELPQDRYGTPAARVRFGDQVLDRLRALPGVERAMIWGPSMFAHSTWVTFLAPTDRVVTDAERLMVWRHSTNPGAIGDLGIRLVAGRDIADTDRLESPLVAIVSEATAQRLWPGQGAVGKQLRIGVGAAATTQTVIGVAADALHRGRFSFSEGDAAREPQLDIYFPYAQRPNNLVTFGIRTTGEPGGFTPAMRSAIAGVDRTLATFDIAPLDTRMRGEESSVGFAALMLNIYGGLAMLLAAIGVYGVLASGVSSRMRELGIRSALGANPKHLQASVVREGLVVAGLAVAVGVAVALGLSRAFGGLLFDVSPTDGRTLVAAATLLVTVAGLASLLPARRASLVDPVRVLRND